MLCSPVLGITFWIEVNKTKNVNKHLLNLLTSPNHYSVVVSHSLDSKPVIDSVLFQYQPQTITNCIFRRSKNFWERKRLTKILKSTKSFWKLQRFSSGWSTKTLTTKLRKVRWNRSFFLLMYSVPNPIKLFFVKKLFVICWWNWDLKSILTTFYNQFLQWFPFAKNLQTNL